MCLGAAAGEAGLHRRFLASLGLVVASVDPRPGMCRGYKLERLQTSTSVDATGVGGKIDC